MKDPPTWSPSGGDPALVEPRGVFDSESRVAADVYVGARTLAPSERVPRVQLIGLDGHGVRIVHIDGVITVRRNRRLAHVREDIAVDEDVGRRADRDRGLGSV